MKIKKGNVLQILYNENLNILDIRVWNDDGCIIVKQCPIYINDNSLRLKQILINKNNQSYIGNFLNNL